MARQSFLRGLAFPIVTLGLAAYFGYYLIYGNHGVINLTRVQHDIEVKQAELDHIRSQREALEHRVSLLRPESVDPDLLEEQARSRLGLTERDEVVILKDRH